MPKEYVFRKFKVLNLCHKEMPQEYVFRNFKILDLCQKGTKRQPVSFPSIFENFIVSS